ncbi:MAG TPA: tyrosine-type recombinase/integrase [Rectinemataceae bacterium]|nr:tyrosine-type recombinase/integrase [Rectinemataceae bacterium]
MELIVRSFRGYLRRERGLSGSTIPSYVYFAERFLSYRFHRAPTVLRQICADDVTRFILRHVHDHSPGRGRKMLTALRSFFRFLELRGRISIDLARCIPAVANWRLAELPKALPPEEVERVLARCNRSQRAGCRDFAVLLLLARLGLRAGEIVALELGDLHWDTGEITVHGKGGTVHRLPMPRAVGQAIVSYLRDARPRVGSTRKVFLRTYPPFTGLGHPSTVSTLVRRAILRAGLRPPRTGAHLFRHSLACQMLRRGATLSEIGQVLRHRHPNTTLIYAKVDLARLRPLAMPWPGGRP